jgi:hypothetical protein
MAWKHGTAPAVCIDHGCARDKQVRVRGARIRAKAKYPWRHMRKDHRLEKEVDFEKYLEELVY